MGAHLTQATIYSKTYWFEPSVVAASETASTLHLLPNYDEYLIAYEDYAPVFDRSLFGGATSLDTVLAGHILVVDGQVVGGRRRRLERGTATIEVEPLVQLGAGQRDALQAAGERYGLFLGVPVAVVVRE